ncbi:DUF4262 domain-containing protein [Pseudomonas luteola]
MDIMNPNLEVIKNIIDQFGLYVQRVHQGPSYPVYAYTIGMTAHGLPELICMGLDPKVIHPYFNMYFYESAIEKVRSAAPDIISDWFNFPLSVIAADFDRVAPYVGLGLDYAEAMEWQRPNFLQWVWTDKSGKFPWDSGWDHSFDSRQPLLVKTKH